MTDMPFLTKLFWGAVETVRVDLAATIEAREALIGQGGSLVVRTRSRLDREAGRMEQALADVSHEAGALLRRRATINAQRYQMWT